MSNVQPPQPGIPDEMLVDADTPRPAYRSYHAWLSRVAEQEPVYYTQLTLPTKKGVTNGEVHKPSQK